MATERGEVGQAMDRNEAQSVPECCHRCRNPLSEYDTDIRFDPKGAAYHHHCGDAFYTHCDGASTASVSSLEFDRYIIKFVPHNTTVVLRDRFYPIQLHCELPVQLTRESVDDLLRYILH